MEQWNNNNNHKNTTSITRTKITTLNKTFKHSDNDNVIYLAILHLSVYYKQAFQIYKDCIIRVVEECLLGLLEEFPTSSS